MFFPYKDDNPKVLIPYVNYSIIGINILIFIFQFTTGVKDPEAEAILLYTYGLIPVQFSILTTLTSMFLHGGIAHILGNMWFLWIFGDNVESTLGHVRYILFYLLCGFFAALCQVLMNPGSEIPMVGASGAIAGVLGLYMIRFPKARVHVFVFIIIFFTTIRVPAIIVLGFWFFNQLTSGLGSLGLDITGGVAWFAHVGGFITGIILHQVFKLIR
jgi:membrane associated rhomboid family serine protease|tara:strand:+ start:1725 stop:2369 length:645 start_codon:yes stop_codon:yes gene_type:complete